MEPVPASICQLALQRQDWLITTCTGPHTLMGRGVAGTVELIIPRKTVCIGTFFKFATCEEQSKPFADDLTSTFKPLNYLHYIIKEAVARLEPDVFAEQ